MTVSLSRERLRIVEERYHNRKFLRLESHQQATVDIMLTVTQYIKQESW